MLRNAVSLFIGSEMPHYVKALLDNSGGWTGTYGTPTTLRYTFTLPSDPGALNQLLHEQPAYVDREQGLMQLTPDDIALIRKAFTYWESIVDIRFKEVPDTHGTPIFRFNQHAAVNDWVEGYGTITTVAGYAFLNHHMDDTGIRVANGIGLANRNFKPNIKYGVILHEVMHWAFKLKHPFSPPNALTNPYEKTTSFSIMNYEIENDGHGHWVRPITPMPADIAAAEMVNGINPRTHAGDTVYHISDFSHDATDTTRTIATIVDRSGTDTLSAAGINSNVILNLRKGPDQRSFYQNGYVVLAYDTQIENVICGARTTVILNELDNTVTAPADARTTIIVDPQHCGHDIIAVGPAVKLVVETTTAVAHPTWKIIPHAFSSADATSYQGTQVEFDENNSVLFKDIKPEEFAAEAIMVQTRGRPPLGSIYADARTYNGFPYELIDDLTHAYLHGMLFACLSILTNEILKEKFGCTPAQIHRINQLVQLALALYSGSALSASAGYVTSSLCHRLNLNATDSQMAATVVSTAVNAAHNVTPLGISKTLVATVGSFVGAGTMYIFESKFKIINRSYHASAKIAGATVSALTTAAHATIATPFTLFGAAKKAASTAYACAETGLKKLDCRRSSLWKRPVDTGDNEEYRPVLDPEHEPPAFNRV